jgi:23S rRNA (adenine1618-N6)-methyltransferase
VRVLDIGTGANVVYPLLGAAMYGWSFVGTEVDATAVAAARANVAANRGVADRIEIRAQRGAAAIFSGVVRPGERFALSICNPPFHLSAEEAAAGTLRKLRNLGGGRKPAAPVLNFGGRSHELWCDGGEVAFVRRMIAESAAQPELCGWFTTLVSKSDHLPRLQKTLRQMKADEVRIIDMAQGQKKSRILAWRFGGLSSARRRWATRCTNML